MPGKESKRKADAAKRSNRPAPPIRIGIPRHSNDDVNFSGTGFRHRVRRWPTSVISNKAHKLVLPDEIPDKKFVLLVGDSHLRSVADGIVPMPVGGLAFGVMSTPGACADLLRLEVSQAVLPREPDAVCVMAPSNNLTASRTVEEAGDAFERYLLAVLSRWPKVFCTSMIPRLVGSWERQDLFQQEYHRRSAKLGVSYVPIHDHLPRYRLKLWCRDGIHLSDNHGMPILTQLMWNASYQFLETHAPKPLVQHQVSRPQKASIVPRVVVKGVERIPPPRPSEWTFVRPSGKRNHSGEFEKTSNSPKKRVVVSKADDTSVALKECFIPLNPVRFSPSILAAMDTIAPADGPTDIQTTSVRHFKKAARRVQQEVASTPCINPLADVESVRSRKEVLDCDQLPSPHHQEASGCPGSVSGSVAAHAVMLRSGHHAHASPRGQSANTPSCVRSQVLLSSLVPETTVQNPVVNNFDKDKTILHNDDTILDSVLGSFHQGDRRFKYGGVQCAAITVVALTKHKQKSVFSWDFAVLDNVVELGDELYTDLRDNKKIRGGHEFLSVPDLPKEIDMEEQSFKLVYGDFVLGDVDVAEGELIDAGVYTPLLDGLKKMCTQHETCIMTLSGNTCAIICDNGRYAVVDSHARSADGMVDPTGQSVVLYFANLDNVFQHFQRFASELVGSQRLFEITGVDIVQMDTFKNVSEQTDDIDINPVIFVSDASTKDFHFSPVSTDVSQALSKCLNVKSAMVESSPVPSCSTSVVNVDDDNSIVNNDTILSSLTGSFNQSDGRFKYGGVQCAAISLVALTKHNIQSVFSWDFAMLDNVVVLGDELYTYLRDSDLISAGNVFLSVPELPKEIVMGKQTFKLNYGDFVCGNVDIVEGELINAGVYTSLWDGLNKMCTQYETCFITLGDNTCALLSEDGHYAIVDSHARSADGMVDPNGKSVILYFSSLDNVFRYIQRFASKLNGTQKLFEISGVNIVQMDTLKNVFEQTRLPPTTGKEVRREESFPLSEPKKLQTDDTDINPVVFVSDVSTKDFHFNPISRDVSQVLSKRLNVKSAMVDESSRVIGELGVPCMNKSIVADGNCFFRALSQAISSTQEYHRKIRLALVNQLKKNPQMYQTILRSEYSSVSQYLTSSRMQYVGSWATEVEIQAAADYFGINIFTYCNDKWLKYTSNSIFSQQAVYLENSNGNHYETVVCVKQPNTGTCYGYCGPVNSISGRYNTRHAPTEHLKCSVETVTLEPSSIDTDGVSVVHSNTLFTPMSADFCKTLCNRLKIDFEKHNSQESTSGGPLGNVCKTEHIIEDGNSFFRAVAHVISGSQKGHRKIRLAVVSYMSKNAEECENFLGKEHASVSEYIKTSQMNYVGHCATEVEFRTTASVLGIPIFINNGTEWVKYSYQTSNFVTEGLYLSNCNNHFEPVLCIRLGNKETCFGFCKVDSLSDNVNKCRRSTMMQLNADPNMEKMKTRKSFSRYLKQNKAYAEASNYKMVNAVKDKIKSQKKNAYKQNVAYRMKKISATKFKYKFLLAHKEKVKKMALFNYHHNFSNKEKVKKRTSYSYHHNLAHREKLKQMSVYKYRHNLAHQEKLKQMSVYKYRHNLAHQEKLKQMSVYKYRHNLAHQEKLKQMSVYKYRHNLALQEKLKQMSVYKYRHNLALQEKLKQMSVYKYRHNLAHREKLKQMSVYNSRHNLAHREKLKQMSVYKYRHNLAHREKLKQMSVYKYRHNLAHREKLKQMSVYNYRHNLAHREKLKQMSVYKYRHNLAHRDKMKELTRKKYLNIEHKTCLIESIQHKRKLIKVNSQNFNFVVDQFLEKVKDGPDFVCCVCSRLLFRHQVLNCNQEYYRKTKEMSLIADKCVSDNHLHKCNDACRLPCKLNVCRNKLYICYTCHYKISKCQIPPESSINKLTVDPIPPQLACLNTLEQHLIAMNIPFMKMLALPKGGQNGIHGPVTCVPANIVETCSLLPRTNMEGSLLPVKLKRKLTYKGHYDYQYVDTQHVQEALQYLKRHNLHYKDVEFNESWINTFTQEDESSVLEEDSGSGKDEDTCIDGEDELLHDRQQHCMFQDTCLMPVDIGQEALDQYVDNILNVAPGEGNNPVKLLSDFTNEAKSFPVLFPSGSNTYYESRQFRLTLNRYFNNRLLHVDGRFANNVEYIFFAQYMSELEQVVSKVSIALRKGKSGESQKLGNLIQDQDSLNKLLEFDDGYRFLKPIRGTPAFWQSAQRDLLACVKMLGKPTWFASFSSADLRWTNLLYSILKQEGRTETVEQLEWADKCDLLRRNPVTAARMFDFRWHVFLREVLMSPANPIGKIEDYYYRVEFQQRGSPHCHCLFWVSGAPILDKNTDEEVIAFVDEYVTCELPSEDNSLHEVVSSVQQHSKRHSKTCRKKKTVCRFNFPRPASVRTFISRGEKYQDAVKTCKCDKTDSTVQCACASQDKARKQEMDKEVASAILTKVKTAISSEDCPYNSVEGLFQGLGISQELFEMAYKRFSRNTHVVLKREVNEIWINQYSKLLLKAWNANLDIQYCVDAYACCVYIISYMSKSEREIGLLLANSQREAAKDGNLSAKEALKSLGNVYLHNRDVCAQEAVYRLTNMHLKECSRKVVFVPTGDNIVKMSLPISVLRQKAASQDLTSDDMWMTGLVDRYKKRPNDDVFNDMCLATFASEYRVLSKNEKCRNPIKLSNDLGFVTKRTRTKPAVVRYARFSETKDSEKFYQSMLQLFLPYRHDGELKLNCETFEEFYRTGLVRFFDRTNHSVKAVVDLNRGKFELESDHLDAVNNIVGDVMLEDAWCELCPAVEMERLECVEILKESEPTVSDEAEVIPDLAPCSNQIAHLEKRNTMSRGEGLALIRSLNEKQFSVFNQIRQWCVDKVNGNNPEPLHVFVTGGAGVGKSHLIRAIEYETQRLLSPSCRHPDNACVVLAAPTGIAAYNLGATTIHTTLSIGKDVRLPYTPLGEEKLNSLRTKYCDLQLLIIDEISMVDHNLLSYVHGRLRQIKQTGDFSSFGSVSVVAVGDFFQLPPVKGKPLYSDGVGSNLWSSLFKVVQLTEVVRQKDAVFSGLLNRIRTHTKGTPLLPEDLKVLKTCETGEASSALHIFATNNQVNNHNIHQLCHVCPDYISITAKDYVNDKRTGKLKLLEGNHARASNTNLSEVLQLGKGARVMLCKNVDVIDGLVNGICGTVTEIKMLENDTFPKKVYVQFDDHRVGLQRRKTSQSLSSNLAGSTPIEPEEERATVKGGLRRQFPLKLAWAVTVHKVQGLTLENAVVSFRKIFAPGQAYVALSRVTSLSGLTIQDFDEKRIYCKDDITVAVSNMTPFLTPNSQFDRFNSSAFTVFLMNVQSLNRHVKDLAFCTQHLQPNCIAVTETWVSTDRSDAVQIDGYSFYNCPRGLAYSSTHESLIAFQEQQHGGVGFYTADGVAFKMLQAPDVNLESLVYSFVNLHIVLGLIYRPPLYPLSLFKVNLTKLLDWLEVQSETLVLMGDFNDDILKSSTILKLLTDRGYAQIVKQPTTEKGTLIDHVYVKSNKYITEASVIPTYFSDHQGIICDLTRL
nr:uncharacterized protein LOC129155826 [Nothobranchius furzeri]